MLLRVVLTSVRADVHVRTQQFVDCERSRLRRHRRQLHVTCNLFGGHRSISPSTAAAAAAAAELRGNSTT